jgi:hypothetical protein
LKQNENTTTQNSETFFEKLQSIDAVGEFFPVSWACFSIPLQNIDVIQSFSSKVGRRCRNE